MYCIVYHYCELLYFNIVEIFDFTGLTIAIMRGFTDVKYMDYSWKAERVCF